MKCLIYHLLVSVSAILHLKNSEAHLFHTPFALLYCNRHSVFATVWFSSIPRHMEGLHFPEILSHGHMSFFSSWNMSKGINYLFQVKAFDSA